MFLALIQAVAKRAGLASPTVAIGNTDENIVRLVELANAEGDDLANIYRWQRLCREATHTSLATESQGLITAIAGSDFNYLAADTFWDRSQNRQLFPVTDVEWQRMKSSSVTGPYSSFRIRGNELLMLPTPSAGHTLAFEWYSKNWCSSAGGTGQSAWASDTDLGVLEEDVMKLGILWRWKAAQGLDYAEDFQTYQLRVQNAASRDGAKGRLKLTVGSGGRLLSNMNVSEGSWT
jgi:hypothetical protein